MSLVLQRITRQDEAVVDDYQFLERRIPVGRLHLSTDPHDPGWHWSVYKWVIKDTLAPEGIAATQEAAIQEFDKAWGQCKMRDYRSQRRQKKFGIIE